MKTKGPLLIIIIAIALFYTNRARPSRAVEREGSASIHALIPYRYDLKIWGYTAPNAIIEAESVRVFARSSSDRTGYFVINSIPIAYEATEICLTTIDSSRRIGFPLCLPLPEDDQTKEIGPIILSPTISLSQKIIWQNGKAVAEGLTVPNSEVSISFFTQTGNTLSQDISNSIMALFHPEAQAASFPVITGQSDKKGNYSINLPTSRSKNYRIFAKALYQNIPSFKSQTLAFSIRSLIEYWLLYIIPQLLVLLSLLLGLIVLWYWERHTKTIRRYAVRFNEKKLKPFGVSSHLQLRQIWYSLQKYWKSNRM